MSATCELCNCPLTILRNGPRSTEVRRTCARCSEATSVNWSPPKGELKSIKTYTPSQVTKKRKSKSSLH